MDAEEVFKDATKAVVSVATQVADGATSVAHQVADGATSVANQVADGAKDAVDKIGGEYKTWLDWYSIGSRTFPLMLLGQGYLKESVGNVISLTCSSSGTPQ